ncbi:hypothetical protein Leryth_010635 [Lithospermum erythrorhizon]|nr:hypothetical protein Leryth_010635 [Lithospermum erythrorhizon]
MQNEFGSQAMQFPVKISRLYTSKQQNRLLVVSVGTKLCIKRIFIFFGIKSNQQNCYPVTFMSLALVSHFLPFGIIWPIFPSKKYFLADSSTLTGADAKRLPSSQFMC